MESASTDYYHRKRASLEFSNPLFLVHKGYYEADFSP